MRFFVNQTFYLVTCPTFFHQAVLSTDQQKSIVFRSLCQATDACRLDADFSVMSDHYHLCGYFSDGSVIPRLIKSINGCSSFELHRQNLNSGKIWGTYHLRVGLDMEVAQKMLGYVIGNPIKHKEIQDLSALITYPFSTYGHAVRQIGKEAVEGLIASTLAVNF